MLQGIFLRLMDICKDIYLRLILKERKTLGGKENIYDEINQDREIAPVWTEAIQDAEGGSSGDSDISRRGRSGADDRLLGSSSERNTSRDNERIWTNPRTKEDYDEIIKKLREMLGMDTAKDSNSVERKFLDRYSDEKLDKLLEELLLDLDWGDPTQFGGEIMLHI